MKRLLIALLLLAPAAFAAYDAFYPVSINGKRFANAVTIAGNLFISVEDFSRAIGGGGTVRVQGNRLALIAPALQASAVAGSSFNPAGAAGGGGMGHDASSATGGAGAGKNAIGSATGGAGAGKVSFNPFSFTRSSDNASPVLMANGKPYVSLADVARLFGGNLNVTVGTLRP